MAGPLRFRFSPDNWSLSAVERDLHRPLAGKFDATLEAPQIPPPPEYDARRLSMGPSHFALFAWQPDGTGAYWLGNTETPEALWRTDKYTFDEVPYPIARWAQRILLADLERTDPWLTDYNYLSWFFLPVFFSKDGRESTRAFFRDHAAGFPDAEREEGLAFYESVLRRAPLDEFRYMMATKLGTSNQVDLVRMRATMAELNAAKLLTDAGYAYVPEVELDSGYTLDFRVTDPDTLIEVTRPEPPTRRRAGTPAAAIRDTVDGKTGNQLDTHGNAVVFVDCTSFRDDEWQSVLAAQPDIGYQPGVVYRMRPDGRTEGYPIGSVGLDLSSCLGTSG